MLTPREWGARFRRTGNEWRCDRGKEPGLAGRDASVGSGSVDDEILWGLWQSVPPGGGIPLEGGGML